ncbi:MAG: 50S ribosomal protein L3 N(5)-glutamine methyltransferase [Alphaproteobacteria bacterium]|nr:50S ribosomal protein L3 N(5)-glutamine methyltransferase [Alphaproteobacteria bacterium]
MGQPATVEQAIAAVSQRLQEAGVALGQGTLRPRDEAAWLVLWSLHMPLDSDDEALSTTLSAPQWDRVLGSLERRIESRMPMAYLSGEAWLQGVPFHVDPRAIIPRSLIAEVLAEGLLDEFIPNDQADVLDLCTGNGSLAVLCAMAWPQARVDGLDLSTDALAVADMNVRRHGLQDRIHLQASDGLAHASGPYDLIVCNPPYVNADSMAQLPPEFRHEPDLALAGGPDGMNFIRPLLTQAASFLHPHGALVLEIGHEFEHFVRAFPRLSGWWLPSSAGDEQVVLITRDALLESRP